MPSVEAVPWHLSWLLTPEMIALKWGAVCVLEAPSSAEIVLGAGAAYRRMLGVSIDEELHLTFAPPAVRELCPRQKRTDIVSLSYHFVQ